MKIYVKPRATTIEAMETLRSRSVLCLTGKEGDEKTSLAYHLIDEMHQVCLYSGEAVFIAVIVTDTHDLKQVIRAKNIKKISLYLSMTHSVNRTSL